MMIFFFLLNIFVEILIHFSAFVYEYKILFYKSFLLINVVLNINLFFIFILILLSLKIWMFAVSRITWSSKNCL